MASVFNRGTRDRPKWFARWKDVTGVWRSKLTHQPTRALAAKVALELQAQAERQRLGIERPAVDVPLVGALMERWALGLQNRSWKDDVGRLRLHVLPRFSGLRVADLTLAEIMRWLDDEIAAARISRGTLRHCLNLISRFFGWAIERGYATANPVRSIPAGRRPQQAGKRDVPWLEDDGAVRRLFEALPEPFNLMFFVANRAGLRLGEVCGLRLSDVAHLREGAIRVRYSYAGPLKEDRRATGKVKWAPAPDDAELVLGPWIARRRAEGAADEAFLFEQSRGGFFRKEAVEAAWERARARLGLTLTWYQATRHSFASRNLARGVPLDEVAAALGHSTPAVTARHYAHFIRKTFSPGMRAPLVAPTAKVLPLPTATQKPAPEADDSRPAQKEVDHAA